MEKKQVILQNGEYLCNIDVSVEEWESILQDETLMIGNYKDVLIKFYNEPHHKSTCKALGDKYDVSPQTFNGTITSFAKAAQKKFNRFEAIGTDGIPTFWIIPMIGKNVGEYFEWTLRPELVQAIEHILIIEKKINSNINYWTFKHKPGKDGRNSAIERVKNALKLNSAIMQYEYGYQLQGMVTQNWNRIQEVKEGDILFLRGDTDIYAVGQVIKPRKKNDIKLSIRKIISNKSHGDYLSGNYFGCIHFEESNVFYEDLSDGEEEWGQRIDVDGWKYYSPIGIDALNQNYYKAGENEYGVLKQIKEKTALEILEKLKLKYMGIERSLLKSNKNLILTGAPGTGKTYLAKQIALQMLFEKDDEKLLSNEEKEIFKEHYCFVQFHPSYDYTDFVEGLRAEDLNGQVIFNLHNGIFKAFCKKAIEKNEKYNFDEDYEHFIEDLSESEIQFETPTHKKKFKIEVNSNKSCVAIPLTDVGTRLSLTKNMIRDYVVHDIIRDWKPYITALGNHFKEKYPISIIAKEKIDLPYIFVIDEINRGEISKIFGELFFSIDPGYLGKDGKVQTQYANIQAGDTIFDEELGQGWFYVPENVYIIGTMNDIDRSVESMDFAMRRRFAWNEIKANDRISMWDGKIDKWKEVALVKMNALNAAIETIQGLSSAYHIGPAYFLKLTNYDGNFKHLWENHLHGVLFEYLRGMPDASIKLDALKAVFNPGTE